MDFETFYSLSNFSSVVLPTFSLSGDWKGSAILQAGLLHCPPPPPSQYYIKKHRWIIKQSGLGLFCIFWYTYTSCAPFHPQTFTMSDQSCPLLSLSSSSSVWVDPWVVAGVSSLQPRSLVPGHVHSPLGPSWRQKGKDDWAKKTTKNHKVCATAHLQTPKV